MRTPRVDRKDRRRRTRHADPGAGRTCCRTASRSGASSSSALSMLLREAAGCAGALRSRRDEDAAAAAAAATRGSSSSSAARRAPSSAGSRQGMSTRAGGARGGYGSGARPARRMMKQRGQAAGARSRTSSRRRRAQPSPRPQLQIRHRSRKGTEVRRKLREVTKAAYNAVSRCSNTSDRTLLPGPRCWSRPTGPHILLLVIKSHHIGTQS